MHGRVGSHCRHLGRPSERSAHASVSNRGGWEGTAEARHAARCTKRPRRGLHAARCVRGEAKDDANVLFLDEDVGDDDGGGGSGGVGGGKVGMYDLQYCGRAPPSVVRCPVHFFAISPPPLIPSSRAVTCDENDVR